MHREDRYVYPHMGTVPVRGWKRRSIAGYRREELR
jgi:hypothetical protein